MKTSLNLSREKALSLVESLVENKGLRNHMLAMEIQMRALWEYFEKERPAEVGETQDAWGLAGLLHDADWEKTESTPDQHPLFLTKKLQKLRAPAAFADSI